jgi:DNA-binding NarL/FixJ family response regulator
MTRDSAASPKDRCARLLIADDHELAREGLRSLLEREAGVEVAGEASSGKEALELCRSLSPDLVLMDVRMPDMDGLEATRAIKRQHPQTTILIVTMYENPDYLFEALKAGASGYVLKDASRPEVIGAVRRVLSGDTLLEPQLANRLLRRIARQSRGPDATPAERLSPREQEVLQLLAEGRTNREIGQALVIGSGTVKGHVEAIIRKLGVSDRTQAAVRGIELGLVRPGSSR